MKENFSNEIFLFFQCFLKFQNMSKNIIYTCLYYVQEI